LQLSICITAVYAKKRENAVKGRDRKVTPRQHQFLSGSHSFPDIFIARAALQHFMKIALFYFLFICRLNIFKFLSAGDMLHIPLFAPSENASCHSMRCLRRRRPQNNMRLI